MKVETTVQRIRSGDVDAKELLELAKSGPIVLRANAIIEISRRGLDTQDVLAVLGRIAAEPPDSGIVRGSITLANLAVAALEWIGSTESRKEYQRILEGFGPERRSDVEFLILNNEPL